MVHETKFYDLLEVSPDAGDDDLRKSYRKLALKFHPDRNPASGDKFAAISQVRESCFCFKTYDFFATKIRDILCNYFAFLGVRDVD